MELLKQKYTILLVFCLFFMTFLFINGVWGFLICAFGVGISIDTILYVTMYYSIIMLYYHIKRINPEGDPKRKKVSFNVDIICISTFLIFYLIFKTPGYLITNYILETMSPV